MLRRLKSGELDERAFGAPDAVPLEISEKVKAPQVPQPAPDAPSESAADEPPKTLDEIILDYLVNSDNK